MQRIVNEELEFEDQMLRIPVYGSILDREWFYGVSLVAVIISMGHLTPTLSGRRKLTYKKAEMPTT